MAISIETKNEKVALIYEMFPSMREDEYQALKADIALNGLRFPLAYCEGKLIDGRHRLRALKELGIDPASNIVDIHSDQATAYIISANLHRRQLGESQIAILIAKLCDAGILTKSQAIELKLVSEGSIASAKRIIKACVPALIDKVAGGVLTVHAVESVRHYPETVQARLAELPTEVWNAFLRSEMVSTDQRKVKTSIVIDGQYAVLIDEKFVQSGHKNLAEYFRDIIFTHLGLSQSVSKTSLEA